MAALHVTGWLRRKTMEVTPTLKATRFSQLKPGELFMFANKSSSGVALAAADPTRDGEMVMIPLGPELPLEIIVRILDSQQMDVLSFGTDYEVRLPADPRGWSIQAPPAEKPCFVLAAGLSEPKLFLRANFSPDAEFRPCYIDIREGRILASTSQLRPAFLTPPSIFGYAVDWAILTKETEPRVILSYPDQKF
jgi:hypothetical protein